MRLVLHPKIEQDVRAVMEYYRDIAGEELAAEFYAELRQVMLEAARRPETFAVRERDLRRANLRRFPYHLLFRIAGETVRILVVRHHRERPSRGTRRR